MKLSYLPLLLFVCLSCAAQSLPPAVTRNIDHQMRLAYKLPPDVSVKITQVTPSSEVPGYDTISVDVGSGLTNKTYTFLISKDRSTLMRLNKMDIAHDAYAAMMQKISVLGRPVRGAQSAKVTVVDFDDFECPFCARLHQTMFPELLKEYGDRVTFIYKDDPVTEIHPWAMHAAVDANCLAESAEAYWEFVDYLHANRQQIDAEKTLDARLNILDQQALTEGKAHTLDSNKLQSCIHAQNEADVRASMQEAVSLNISGTPVLFINGERIDGTVPLNELRLALNKALEEAQDPAPTHALAAQSSQ